MREVLRILIYLVMNAMIALSIVLTGKSQLGVSTISSLPYVCSCFTSISFGMWTTISYLIFILVEIILYRKIGWKTVLQLPYACVFGKVVDLFMAWIRIPEPGPVQKAVLLAVGILLLGIAVPSVLAMELIASPADAFVEAIAHTAQKPFGTVKIAVDLGMTAAALVLCLVFVHRLEGIGIGTLIMAVCNGWIMGFFEKKSVPFLKKIAFEKELPE